MTVPKAEVALTPDIETFETTFKETVPKAEVELTPLRVTVTGVPETVPKSEKGASENATKPNIFF